MCVQFKKPNCMRIHSLYSHILEAVFSPLLSLLRLTKSRFYCSFPGGLFFNSLCSDNIDGIKLKTEKMYFDDGNLHEQFPRYTFWG